MHSTDSQYLFMLTLLKHRHVMLIYYCETCDKVLERNEQRRNYEKTTTPGAVVVTELGIVPGHPFIGRQFTKTTTALVDRRAVI